MVSDSVLSDGSEGGGAETATVSRPIEVNTQSRAILGTTEIAGDRYTVNWR